MDASAPRDPFAGALSAENVLKRIKAIPILNRSHPGTITFLVLIFVCSLSYKFAMDPIRYVLLSVEDIHPKILADSADCSPQPSKAPNFAIC